jgi:outer membrane lipoprotein carrier protein
MTRNMNNLFVPALALLLASTTPVVTEQPAMADPPKGAAPGNAVPSVQEALKKVQDFYDATTTFRASFTQTFTIKLHNTEKTSTGTVYFKKPGKMRWDYDNKNRVVTDGNVLKVYEADKSQMFLSQVNKSQYPAALSFLTGGGKLGDSFKFEIRPGSDFNFPGGYVLIGNPPQPNAGPGNSPYQKVLFYVDAASSQVRRVLILDWQSNRNRFDFNDPHRNEDLKDTFFKFDPPPGTSIIQQ